MLPDKVIEYVHRRMKSIEQSIASIPEIQDTTKIKRKIKHKSLGKEISQEIPLSTGVVIRLKKMEIYDIESENNSKIDFYYEEIDPMFHYYNITRPYGKQLFILPRTIVIHPEESLSFLLREDQNYPINGIVNKDCTRFKIKVMVKKDGVKGIYYTITEKPRKALGKTEQLVKLYDLDFSKQDMDKVSDDIIIEITNRSNADLIVKGRDDIEKDESKPYEFWIHLEETESVEYRKKLISPSLRDKPPIIPLEECNIKQSKIDKLCKVDKTSKM